MEWENNIRITKKEEKKLLQQKEKNDRITKGEKQDFAIHNNM